MVRLNAQSGSGSKRAAWVEDLNQDLHSEFDRFRRIGVKFSVITLRFIAIQRLERGSSEVCK